MQRALCKVQKGRFRLDTGTQQGTLGQVEAKGRIVTRSVIEIPSFLLLLAGFALACLLIARFLPLLRAPQDPTPLKALQTRMGMTAMHSGLFLLVLIFWALMLTFWAVLFLALFLGLLSLLYDVVAAGLPDTPDIQAEWRFTLTKIVALTAVLGAVVALPFTLIRLHLNRQQVDTARDALFNDKIDVAVTDLHAQRQVTRWSEDGKAENGWEDDITRRNGAIDRLEGLVQEDQTLAPRVSRMLSVYVRELSRSTAPAVDIPKKPEDQSIRDWAFALTVQRSDMEKAVQTLGRLPVLSDQSDMPVRPTLTHANLQGFNLRELTFVMADLGGAHLQGTDLCEAHLQGADLNSAHLQGAHLDDANLQGANLSWASFQGAYLGDANLQGANLSLAKLQGARFSRAQFDTHTVLIAAELQGAAMRNMDLRAVPQIAEHLEFLFGDSTVQLPDDISRPDRFNQRYKTYAEFKEAWRAFQRSIGQDPDDF